MFGRQEGLAYALGGALLGSAATLLLVRAQNKKQPVKPVSKKATGKLMSGVDAASTTLPSRTFSHDKLRAIMRIIMEKAGSSAEEQAIVSNHLVEACLKGHDSHGVQMLPLYIAAMKNKELAPNQHLRVIAGGDGPVITTDGLGGYGQVMATEATKLAIQAAKKHGVCVLGLRRSHHIGRVGAYGEMCAKEGLVYISWANVYSVVVAPFGGTDGRCGTNPFTCAMPSADGASKPMVCDFATSIIANGKLQNMMMQGKVIPVSNMRLDHKSAVVSPVSWRHVLQSAQISRRLLASSFPTQPPTLFFSHYTHLCFSAHLASTLPSQDGYLLDHEGKDTNDPSVTWRTPKGCIKVRVLQCVVPRTAVCST
jgi:LDH2 family malate/lactate/ureidoglycolate dehydrogenase